MKMTTKVIPASRPARRGASAAGAFTCNGLYAAATLPTTSYTFSLTNVPGQHLFQGLTTGSLESLRALVARAFAPVRYTPRSS